MAIYVKFDGIDGESRDAGHKGWSEILTCSWEGNLPSSGVTTKGRAKSECTFEPILLLKTVDKSTPLLFELLVTGGQKDVTIEFCESSGDQVPYMTIKLLAALISHFSIDGNSDDVEGSVNRIGVSYNDVELTYKDVDDSAGGGQATFVKGYNLAERVAR